MSLQERAARGAAWLDQEMPGWANRIDTETLWLGSCTQCVLGQLYGHIDKCPHTEEQWEDDNGFNLPLEEADSWAELNDAWLHEIQKRREE